MTTNSATFVVSRVSKSTVKPGLVSEESQKPFHLTPWDLRNLNLDYPQYGLAFARPQGSMSAILGQLKTSLSTALTYFFSLSGRLVTQDIQHQPSHHHVWINCKESPGVEFIHSVANATLSDVLSDHAVTTLFPSLFPLDPGTLNSQGHTLPLLLVQVTELFDGIFIAFACNHVVADGVSFWHFTSSWSEICRKQKQPSEKLNEECVIISRPPIMRRWFLNNQNSIISLPNSTAPPHPIPCDTTVKQRVFHFTSKSIARIKAKANAECNYTDRISSFQAMIAFTWRSTTVARRLLPDQNTTCGFLVDSRSRLDPPLSENYFGNCSLGSGVTCTAGELLSNNLGWAAWMLHKEISNHTYHNSIHPFLEEFTKAPSLDSYADITDMNVLVFGSSPRFDVYGNDFGWGNPVALRWYATPVDGFIQSAPGRDRGSVDLMTCLSTETMGALEANDEFMHAVSLTNLGMRSDLCSRY